MVLTLVENPRVGGSIPPQATSVFAPQRPTGSEAFAFWFRSFRCSPSAAAPAAVP
jgi:hypothetical protein